MTGTEFSQLDKEYQQNLQNKLQQIEKDRPFLFERVVLNKAQQRGKAEVDKLLKKSGLRYTTKLKQVTQTGLKILIRIVTWIWNLSNLKKKVRVKKKKKTVRVKRVISYLIIHLYVRRFG